jgi:2-polyprenyl-6-hydroxyphenyl methylase/3-demethylubiquinone-9 3-methyltransferase
MGSKDFGHSGNDHFAEARQFGDYGVQIAYFRCSDCGLVFTNALDAWKPADFKAHIYNGDYGLADPPFESERPTRNARMIAGLWHADKAELTFLDFGGGAGAMARCLRDLGVACESSDSFYGVAAPLKRFDVVTCFEVIEHVPHFAQKACLEAISAQLAPGGTVLLSTTILDPTVTVEHWYICPRNGHITMHSAKSLALLAAGSGFDMFSVNTEMHLLRRTPASALPHQKCYSC